MTILLLAMLVLIVVLVTVGAAGRGGSGAVPPRTGAEPPDRETTERPNDLALRDPVEARLRDGTPADAARLSEQVPELHRLGYRTPPK